MSEQIPRMREVDSNLVSAINAQKIFEVQAYIDHGADVNANQCRPMKAAASLGNTDIMELLIANGADINGDHGGPLSVALGRARDKAVLWLLEHGADPAANDGQLLVTAASVGTEAGARALTYLIEAGAPLDRKGEAALNTATRCAHFDNARVLLAYGVPVTAAAEVLAKHLEYEGWRELFAQAKARQAARGQGDPALTGRSAAARALTSARRPGAER